MAIVDHRLVIDDVALVDGLDFADDGVGIDMPEFFPAGVPALEFMSLALDAIGLDVISDMLAPREESRLRAHAMGEEIPEVRLGGIGVRGIAAILRDPVEEADRIAIPEKVRLMRP